MYYENDVKLRTYLNELIRNVQLKKYREWLRIKSFWDKSFEKFQEEKRSHALMS